MILTSWKSPQELLKIIYTDEELANIQDISSIPGKIAFDNSHFSYISLFSAWFSHICDCCEVSLSGTS